MKKRLRPYKLFRRLLSSKPEGPKPRGAPEVPHHPPPLLILHQHWLSIMRTELCSSKKSMFIRKTYSPNVSCHGGWHSLKSAVGTWGWGSRTLTFGLHLCVSKLLWRKPLGKARWRAKLKSVNERLVLADKGSGRPFLELSMKTPAPNCQTTLEDEVLDEHGLSQQMARKLHAAARQGQVGKAWKQMRYPPPAPLTPEVWAEAKSKLKPHGDMAMPTVDARSRHPTNEHCTTVTYELKHNNAVGWTTESAILPHHLPPLWGAWLTHIVQGSPDHARARAWHAHKSVFANLQEATVLSSSALVWVKLLSRLLLKEAGAPLKELAENTQFGVGVPHGGLALLTKVRSAHKE